MLAYSSIEHMGVIALGAAAGGPLAVAAVLLHMLGHGLAKGSLFVSAGQMLQCTGTSRIDGVRGLAVRFPLLAGCAGAGVLALVGLPPFSIFASEIGILRAGFSAGLGWATAAALALMLVITAALLGHTSRMLLGAGASAAPATVTGAEPAPSGAVAVGPAAGLAPAVAALAACAVLGVYAGPLATLLHSAARTLTGTP
jgi:hydrogenase-4 component F